MRGRLHVVTVGPAPIYGIDDVCEAFVGGSADRLTASVRAVLETGFRSSDAVTTSTLVPSSWLSSSPIPATRINTLPRLGSRSTRRSTSRETSASPQATEPKTRRLRAPNLCRTSRISPRRAVSVSGSDLLLEALEHLGRVRLTQRLTGVVVHVVGELGSHVPQHRVARPRHRSVALVGADEDLPQPVGRKCQEARAAPSPPRLGAPPCVGSIALTDSPTPSCDAASQQSGDPREGCMAVTGRARAPRARCIPSPAPRNPQRSPGASW